MKRAASNLSRTAAARVFLQTCNESCLCCCCFCYGCGRLNAKARAAKRPPPPPCVEPSERTTLHCTALHCTRSSLTAARVVVAAAAYCACSRDEKIRRITQDLLSSAGYSHAYTHTLAIRATSRLTDRPQTNTLVYNSSSALSIIKST